MKAAKLSFVAFACTVSSQALAAEPVFKPIIDFRLRYEHVEQDGLTEEAEAVTARARAGFDVALFSDTRLLAEAEGTLAINEDYNSSTLGSPINGKTRFPIVSDPENIELNRLQIQNKSLPGTVLTIGRQRINLDDQRFVGSVGWRDNEQTFDAVRIENSSIKNLKLDATYAWSDRTIAGIDSPLQSIKGDNVFLNAGYKTKLGTLTGFGYWIDQDHPLRVQFSSKTYGARFAGKTPLSKTASLSYTLSYAHQTEAFDNPRDYSADYYLADAALGFGGFSVGGGYEVLGADDGRPFTSFQTPLATLHKFQGWTDKFLVTPANGIRDAYGSVGYTFKKVGPFTGVTFTAVYHDYRSDRLDQHYGEEVNLQLLAKYKKLTFTAKYGDYEAKSLFTDTKKFWLAVDYAY